MTHPWPGSVLLVPLYQPVVHAAKATPARRYPGPCSSTDVKHFWAHTQTDTRSHTRARVQGHGALLATDACVRGRRAITLPSHCCTDALGWVALCVALWGHFGAHSGCTRPTPHLYFEALVRGGRLAWRRGALPGSAGVPAPRTAVHATLAASALPLPVWPACLACQPVCLAAAACLPARPVRAPCGPLRPPACPPPPLDWRWATTRPRPDGQWPERTRRGHFRTHWGYFGGKVRKVT